MSSTVLQPARSLEIPCARIPSPVKIHLRSRSDLATAGHSRISFTLLYSSPDNRRQAIFVLQKALGRYTRRLSSRIDSPPGFSFSPSHHHSPSCALIRGTGDDHLTVVSIPHVRYGPCLAQHLQTKLLARQLVSQRGGRYFPSRNTLIAA